MLPTSRSSSLILPGLILLASTAQAGIGDFLSQVSPAYRGTPGSEFAGFDVFSQASVLPNSPDLPNSCSSAQLAQLDAAAILTSTGNIYSFGTVTRFELTSQNEAPVLAVSLQLRTLANPLDYSSVLLRPLDAFGVPLGAIAPSQVQDLGVGEVQFEWSGLSGVVDFRLDFVASAPSMSLDVALLDVQTARPALSVSQANVSLAAGGLVQFGLDGGSATAGDLYLLVGSVSGTTPGIALGGPTLPINLDAYTLFSIEYANQAPFASNLGFLSSCGRASASLTVPANLNPALVGTQFDHAFFVLDSSSGSYAPVLASNSAAFTLIP